MLTGNGHLTPQSEAIGRAAGQVRQTLGKSGPEISHFTKPTPQDRPYHLVDGVDVVAMLGTYSRLIVAFPDDRTQRLAEARAALEARLWCWRADRIARGGEH